MFYIHKQKDNAKIICEDCGEPFMTYGYLNKHRSVKHSDERPHVCSYCCQTFKQRRTLQAHVKYKHQEHKSCQYCKESFDNSADLYRHHEWIHPQESQQVEIDGVTVLECDICGKVMGSKTALYTHNKNSHGVIQKASKIETIIRHAGRLWKTKKRDIFSNILFIDFRNMAEEEMSLAEECCSVIIKTEELDDEEGICVQPNVKPFENPWAVDSLSWFLFYNCPECDFATKDESTFQYHAIESHIQV
jgi:uncharacterized C2H2 Zn-finger protein